MHDHQGMDDGGWVYPSVHIQVTQIGFLDRLSYFFWTRQGIPGTHRSTSGK